MPSMSSSNTGNQKASCIDSVLQGLVDCIVVIEPLNLSLFNAPKKKTRVIISASSCFYDLSWLTDANKFLEAITYFVEIIANSQVIDFSF